MVSKNRIIQIFYAAITMNLFFACGQNNSTKKNKETENVIIDKLEMTIDTFSVFPTEIEGCACYFSNDSTEFEKGEYIYCNNYDKISYLKINGVMTKFVQTENSETYRTFLVSKTKNEKYELTIEISNENQNGEETSLLTGRIKLKDQKGKTIISTFYGECGC